jgi:ADP-heptose:LPS heptosyltransferase
VKILFITATRIGDAVLNSGLLAWLVATHPGARLTIACGPPAAPLFAAVPGLERIIVVTKRTASAHWLLLWRDCVGQMWDLIVDLRGSALSYALLARQRKIQWSSEAREHRVREVARLFALDPPPAPRVFLAQQHRDVAARHIPPGSPVLAIGPAANWPAKTWPADRFATLIAHLTAPGGALPNARVAIFGGAEDRDALRPVVDSVPPARCIDLAGRIDLLTVAACLERCALYVGNDSGLMHIAAATGIPTLGLFGPSRDERYGPWGPNATAIRTPESFETLMAKATTMSGTVMTSLSVDAVEQAAVALLARAARPQAASR